MNQVIRTRLDHIRACMFEIILYVVILHMYKLLNKYWHIFQSREPFFHNPEHDQQTEAPTKSICSKTNLYGVPYFLMVVFVQMIFWRKNHIWYPKKQQRRLEKPLPGPVSYCGHSCSWFHLQTLPPPLPLITEAVSQTNRCCVLCIFTFVIVPVS